MDEQDWETTDNALAMLEHLFGMRSPDSLLPEPPRSIWLYLLACSRKAWNRLPWVMRVLVEVAEQLPDRNPVDERLKSSAKAAAEELINNPDPDDAALEAERWLALADRLPPPDHQSPVLDHVTWAGVSHLIYFPYYSGIPAFKRIATEFHCAQLVREVFGNPFKPVAFLQQWRTRDVIALARGAYLYRDFSGMPKLADALQEAGCENEQVLDHCRGPNGHVNGCWVLNGLLDAASRRTEVPIIPPQTRPILPPSA